MIHSAQPMQHVDEIIFFAHPGQNNILSRINALIL